jgi:predicted Fe-Mo cluster-binding NifX family protein
VRRVAIPVSNDMLSEYFGQCSYYEIFEISENGITGEKIKMPYKEDITKLPEWMADKGVSDVIVFKVDKRIINLFSTYRINLFVGISIDTPKNLIEGYINGNLKSNERIISEIIK